MNQKEKSEKLTELISRALLAHEKSITGDEQHLTAEKINNEWLDKYTGRNYTDLKYNTFRAIVDSTVGVLMRDLD